MGIEKYTVNIKELLKKNNTDGSLVSIIIPVYNVEKYLERCIISVLAQTYKNIEVILVDDGSLDKSGLICDEYGIKDNRIRVVHQTNQGQSSARNKGIELAKGKYLTFVDSDDRITPDYVEVMIAASHKFNVEIVQTRILIENKKMEKLLAKTDNFEILTFQPGKEAVNDMRYKVSPCAKLFKTSIIKNNPFPNFKANEDDASYYRFAYEANRICIIDYYTYYYCQTDNSVMRSTEKKKDKKTDYIPIYYERINFFRKRNEEGLLLGTRNRFCLIVMLNYAFYKKNGTNAKDLPELLRVFREQYSWIRREKMVGFIRGCAYKMFYYFPNITAKIINIIRK